ncbi:hypothetical protein EON65_03505 [archaeon]|nr:MAG: hypothetical protein EON65_03505 [archaeon]
MSYVLTDLFVIPLQSFVKDKGPDDDVFEFLTPPVLNKHLNSLMKGLTAKVGYLLFSTQVQIRKLIRTIPYPYSY